MKEEAGEERSQMAMANPEDLPEPVQVANDGGLQYQVILHRSGKGTWIAQCPALHGIDASAPTRRAALAQIRELILQVLRRNARDEKEIALETHWIRFKPSEILSDSEGGEAPGAGQDRVNGPPVHYLHCTLASGETAVCGPGENDREIVILINTQAFLWNQAKQLWLDLSKHEAKRTIEACVLLTVLVGTSIAHLLGQSKLVQSQLGPKTKKDRRKGRTRQDERVPSPGEAFDALEVYFNNVSGSDVDEDGTLKERFDRFLEAYDRARHYGPPKWEQIRELRFDAVSEFMQIAQEIWQRVIRLAQSEASSQARLELEAQLRLFEDDFTV